MKNKGYEKFGDANKLRIMGDVQVAYIVYNFYWIICAYSQDNFYQPALVDELSIDSKGLISVIVYLKIVPTFYWILFNCNNWRQVEQPSSNTFKLKQIHKKENVNGSFNYWFLKNSFWF